MVDRTALFIAVVLAATACRPKKEQRAEPSVLETAAPSSEALSEAPAESSPAPSASADVVPTPPPLGCPADMVRVEPHPRTGATGFPSVYCVDRYEDTVVDRVTSKPATPYYPPDPQRCAVFERVWLKTKGGGTVLEQGMDLPPLPGWEKSKDFVPMAVSREGAVPQAYASANDAEHACRNAGKRLCSMVEWREACRGEEDRDFPYGDKYEAGACNIFGPAHPGVLLWNDPTINHTDPRFNLVKYKGALLLHRTGATKRCVSRWGADGIYDMNGNVDEWIDDPKGMFLGGFYARGKKDGCQSRVTAHPRDYSDYSTGIRCCEDAAVVPETSRSR